MKGMHVFAALNSVVWGGLVLLGFSLMRGVTDQHVPGYPNSGQIGYYVRMPVVMSVFTLGLYLLSFVRRMPCLFLVIEVLALLLFFPYMLAYTGGI